MSEFIERMARAAYSKWIEGVESLEPPWDQMPQDFRDRMIGAQRAALEAAREPTEAMQDVIRGVPCSCDCYNVPRDSFLVAYHEMIDEALK